MINIREGELAVRGGTVMKGYLGNPGATAATIGKLGNPWATAATIGKLGNPGATAATIGKLGNPGATAATIGKLVKKTISKSRLVTQFQYLFGHHVRT